MDQRPAISALDLLAGAERVMDAQGRTSEDVADLVVVAVQLSVAALSQSLRDHDVEGEVRSLVATAALNFERGAVDGAVFRPAVMLLTAACDHDPSLLGSLAKEEELHTPATFGALAGITSAGLLVSSRRDGVEPHSAFARLVEEMGR